MSDTFDTVHHIVKTRGSFTPEELVALGTQLFEINVRTRDDSDQWVLITGRFGFDDANLIFITMNARGSSERVGEKGLEHRVGGYIKFVG